MDVLRMRTDWRADDQGKLWSAHLV
eukprot:SAG25_NODE_9418_length_373_cov_0.854015_1_plen_24_part_01